MHTLLSTPLLFEYFSAPFLYQHLMLLFPAKWTENIQGMKTLEYLRQKQYSFLLLISFCMTWLVIHFRRTWCVRQSLSLLYLFDTYCCPSQLKSTKVTRETGENKRNMWQRIQIRRVCISITRPHYFFVRTREGYLTFTRLFFCVISYQPKNSILVLDIDFFRLTYIVFKTLAIKCLGTKYTEPGLLPGRLFNQL